MIRYQIAVLWASLLTACASVPSPLAPGVHGSIGSSAFGLLTEATPLPNQGPGFRRLRPWSDRKYGTSSLILLLTDAARQSARQDEPPLLIGDLAAPGGGPISGHRSHRTGRDVDLLFFFTSPAGVPVEAPGFVRVGPDGLADAADGVFVRFDLPRNWRLIHTLITSEKARTQWIFVAPHIKGLLLEYARALDEPAMLLWQAENILHPLRQGSPHDDHFHLRIACSDDEAITGCFTDAPWWPWWPDSPTFQGEFELDDPL